MKRSRIVNFLAGLAVGISIMTPVQAVQYTSPLYPFSIDDVQGGFNGSTFGTTGAVQDDSILCDAPGSSASCPSGVQPIVNPKMPQGAGTSPALYPVDSEFGFYVVDFLGGAQKIRDNDYMEGFVGNITDALPTSAEINGQIIQYNPPIQGGIAVSNASTDTYKAKTPLGSWCRGLGGNSVKCETEHYSVLEHVLSCHEVIPYFFADPVSGTQAMLPTQPFPVDFGTTDCALKGLDDVMFVLENDVPTIRLTDATVGVQMEANDKTVLTDDIALSTDYAVRLKADGKANYTWGGMVKLPNDIRIYKRLALPDEWKVAGANYAVTAAKLVVRHTITNNPNDQLRPEDIENEAATGRKPSYEITSAEGGDVWKSTIDCFEGDGDFIETDDGATDPVPIEAGTVLKNGPFSFTDYDVENDLYAFSGDLVNGFTNAYYTTINRDPFEWSYVADPTSTTQNFIGSWLQNDALGALVTGPRWRLRPNKFGQDLPGLEIPLIECSEPPFEKDNIKYGVGVQTITEINLLDWDEVNDGPSPLATTRGWVDVTQNGAADVAQIVNGVDVTDNGLPMTEDLDLAVYIKGDKKPVAIYDVQLEIDYEAAVPIVVPNVLGLSEAVARDELAPDLSMNVIGTACSNDYPLDTVSVQDPVAGETLFVGDTVDVTLSEGPCTGETIPVPAVGECPTVAEATAILEDDGLTVNPVVVEEESEACAAGLVLSTIPTAGTEVALGTEVTLVVATEPVVEQSDVTIASVSVPDATFRNRTRPISVTIANDAAASAAGSGTVTVTGSDGTFEEFTFTDLMPGDDELFSFTWTSPRSSSYPGTTVDWTFEVTVEGVIVDTATASTRLRGS